MKSDEGRRSARKQVQLAAKYRTTTGLRDRGQITDITGEGCRIVSECLTFRVGMHLAVRPDGLEALTGTVRWADGFLAGIQFDSLIYEPIVDHLAKSYPASLEVLD